MNTVEVGSVVSGGSQDRYGLLDTGVANAGIGHRVLCAELTDVKWAHTDVSPGG